MTDNLYLPEGNMLGTDENKGYISSLYGLEKARLEGKILEGIAVMCDNSDFSLRVDLSGMTGIIPKSEALMPDGTDIKDIAVITRVGKPVCFKVMHLTKDANGNPAAILSRRAAQEECNRNFISKLRVGDIVPARVTHLEPFGAFVDIGCGIVSLLSVDSISVSRISHPRDRLFVRQELTVVVKSIDRETGRICVSHRELLGTWEENASLFSPGQTVAGIVRSVEEYGAFIELSPNLAGLAELRDEISVGQSCAVYIKSIIREKMKIKLVIIDSCRGASPCGNMKYFIDTNRVKHIDYWRYSPDGCDKIIESVFSE